MQRSEFIKNAKRIVVKVGTSIITADTGRIDDARISNIVSQLAGIWSEDYEVLLVSSGSIACGLEALGLKSVPKKIPELQASASVGQGLLIHKYASLFKEKNINVGQVLLTQRDTTHREQYVNAKNTLEELLELKAIPIINENDSTVIDEIKFGDNDTLAALVANIVGADLLIILSDVDGLFSANPKSENAELISLVDSNYDGETGASAGGSGTTFGKGGMETKIEAAKMATAGQAGVVIANGHKENVLADILAAKLEGTFFIPRKEKIAARRIWILNQPSKGTIFIDKGAEKAIRAEGRSLLAAGIKKAEGKFDVGDAVKITVKKTDPRLIKGIVNYNSEEVNKVAGKSNKEIVELLGVESAEEVVHRDNMVMMKLKIKLKN